MDARREGEDTASSDWAPNSLVLLAGYAVLFAIACIPIFSIDVLPLGDLLNHVARVYVLNNLDTETALQKYYGVHWDLFSFQSTDLLLPPLARWFGLERAVQIFVVAVFALLIGGTAAVHRVLFGRVGLWPGAAFLFIFNFPLISGQVSYLFSTGLSLLLFAAWIATEHWPRAIRLPLYAAASFGLMLCHFFAFSAYALLVLCFALGRPLSAAPLGEKLRRLSEAALPLVPGATCFLWSFGQTISGTTSYGGLLDKAIPMLVGTLTYGRWPDIVLTIAAIATLWWLNRRRRITLAPALRLSVLVLVLTAIAMPSVLRGVFGADLRLPILLYFLLVAGSEIQLHGRRQAIAFATGVFALLVARVGILTVQWAHFNADYREFRAAEYSLEPGSRVAMLPIPVGDHRALPQPQTPYWWISCFAVMDRQVFMPRIYTYATPLQFTGKSKELYSETLARSRTVRWHRASAFVAADPETVLQVERVGQRISNDDTYSSTIDWSDWPERFDYLIDFHLGRPGNPVPALLTEVSRGSYFAIYRIHPPQP